MRHVLLLAALAGVFTAFAVSSPLSQHAEAADEKAAAFPAFEMKEIDKSLGVGYAVLLVDVNGDGKKDIVVVDTTRVVWYENPTWKRRTIIEGGTRSRTTSASPRHDIDGDGQLDFALGADWKPFNTKAGGTLAMAQARQDARRAVDASTPSARSRRSIASASPTSTAAANRGSSSRRSWAGTPPRRRTGWTAPRCGCSPIASRRTRCRTAGCPR